MDTAERRLTYFRANVKRLEADLLVAQQRLASTRTTLGAANANLTAAQQDLDDANKAYTAAGCANDKGSAAELRSVLRASPGGCPQKVNDPVCKGEDP